MKITHQHYLYIRGENQLKLVVNLLGAGQLVLLRCVQECLNVGQGNVNTLSRLVLVYSLGSQEVDSRFTPPADLWKRNTVPCAVSLTTAQPPQSLGRSELLWVYQDSGTLGTCCGTASSREV